MISRPLEQPEVAQPPDPPAGSRDAIARVPRSWFVASSLLACDAPCAVADGSLIGVLIGGGLTLSGQLCLETLRIRRERARRRDLARAAARLQRDDYTSGLEAVRYCLEARTWWPSSLEIPLSTELEDRRLLANHLTATEFRRVAGSVRRLALLRARRTAAIDNGTMVLSDDDYQHAAACYRDLEAARYALAELADYATKTLRPLLIDPEIDDRARRMANLPPEATSSVSAERR
jgi:hypothetical protein